MIAASDARTDPRTREFLGQLPRPARHRRDARRAAAARQHDGRRALRRTRRRRARLDRRRAELRDLGRPTSSWSRIAEEERRNALARLAESEARARLIVDTAHDAFIGIDSAGSIVAWNAQAEADVRLDARRGRSAGTWPKRSFPPAFRDAHNNGMRRFHETGEAPVRQSASRADGAATDRGASSRSSSRSPSPMRRRERVLLRRVPQGHLRSARTGRRAPPREGVGRSRDAGQERVPGQHEPRAEDAAERRARLRAAPPAGSEPERRRSARRWRRSPSAGRSCWI